VTTPNGTSAEVAADRFAYATTTGARAPRNITGTSTRTTSRSSTPATAGGAGTATPDTTAQAIGAVGSLTVETYAANPGSSPGLFQSSAGTYFDVHTSAAFTQVAISQCNATSSETMYWWDGATWQGVSPKATYDGSTHCLAFTATASSSPTTAQLTGTPFGIAVSSDTAIASAIGSVSHTGDAITAIPFGTKAGELMGALTSTDGSTQAYGLVAADGKTAVTGSTALLTGDELIVTAADGAATATYAVSVAASSDTSLMDAAADGGTYVTSIVGTTIGVAYGTTADDLTGALTSTDGSTQSYAVEDSGQSALSGSTELVTGDQLVVTAADGTTAPYQITVNPAPDADESTVMSSAASVASDGKASATITVTVKDASGEPIQGVVVTLAGTTGTHSQIASTEAKTNSSGVATFTVTDLSIEIVAYTATADGVPIAAAAQVAFTPYLTCAWTESVEGSLTLEFNNVVEATTVTAADLTFPGGFTVTYIGGSGTTQLHLSVSPGVPTAVLLNTALGQTDITAGGFAVAPAAKPVVIQQPGQVSPL